MRIALITDGLHPYVMGGMQRHSTMLAQYLPEHGVELVVFHTAHEAEAISSAKRLEGFPDEVKKRIQHIFVDYPKRGRLPGHYIGDNCRYSQRVLEAYLKLNQQFDFIYAKGLTGHAFVEAKKEGIALPPIGMKAHGYEMFQRAANFRVKLEHLLLRSAFRSLTQDSDYVFSYGGKISTIIREKLRVPGHRILEVPTGIDPGWLADAVSPVSSIRRVVFLGRYERRKGIEELHQVLQSWEGPQMEFVFIGPIPEENRLNLPWVSYTGSVTDSDVLKAELDQADILVCPSYSEGMPNVIMEAMARGLAIIATDVGATSIVVSAENGKLISSLSLGALSRTLKELLELSDDQLLDLKEHSRVQVESFSWEKIARITVQKIQGVID
ncbi:glycosyltransferase family 4 protein [Akkermansiaceae bacterium]|nr:glycosyltransferase family 4 protein [Akkermansiaceae bacterium]